MSAATPRGQTEDVCPKHGLCPNLGPGLRPVDRWELLSLVTDLRTALGLSDRDVMVLRAHLSVLPHGLLQPGRINVSFMEVAEILSRACGMDERRFRRGEAKLAQLGLVRRRLSANGRRFPERDRSGRIVGAYGIDLSPLIARRAELLEMRDRIETRRLELKQRKNAISARFQSVLRSLARLGRTLPLWGETLRERLRKAVRRKGTEMDELDALDAEVSQLEASIDVPCSAHLTPNPGKADDPAITPQYATASPVRNPGDDGQTVRRIESKHKEENTGPQISVDTETIRLAWAKTTTLRQFYAEPPSRDRDLAAVLIEFSSFLGLGQDRVLRGLSLLGWSGMITAVDYLAARAGEISRPEGYFISMLRKYEAGNPIAGGRIVPRPLLRRPAKP